MSKNYYHLGEFSDLAPKAASLGGIFPPMKPGAETRRQIRDLLGFSSEHESAVDLQMGEKWVKDGVEGQALSWSCGFGPRTEAWYLRPAGVETPLPAVLALHDHGGFKFFGKEKIADGPQAPHRNMVSFWQQYYGGVPWTNQLAKRGYAVLVHDAFLWGSRKFQIATMQRSIGKITGGWSEQPDLEREFAEYNDTAGAFEHVVEKYSTILGTSMAGVVCRDDRIALDTLSKLPGVDAGRLACLGLSGGGNRSCLLAATADHLKAAGVVGLMTTYEGLLDHNVQTHTWMLFPPLLSRIGDWPDLAASRAPTPLMVLYDLDDNLFTVDGMQAADRRLKEIYASSDAPEAYLGKFYPGPHKFDLEMQKDAFDWLDRTL